jgi:RNA polymerase sigma factor (sigma-70 family)
VLARAQPSARALGRELTVRGAPPRLVYAWLAGAWVTQSIAVVAQLDVADRLKAGPKTCDELAAETSLRRSQIEDLIVAERSPRALDEPLRSDDGAGATLGDLLADPHAEEAYERVPQRIVIETLPALLEALNDRERRIMCARFGLGSPERTLREVAAELGVSAERVRQLEARALEKLRAAVDQGLDRRRSS